MCKKCVRKFKRLGLPRWFSYGRVKVYAHRLLNGEGIIPIFRDNRINIAIEAHVYKIKRARTKG